MADERSEPTVTEGAWRNSRPAERFGREQFKREFVDVVAETLNDRPASVEATALR